jgi:hypothetical protein
MAGLQAGGDKALARCKSVNGSSRSTLPNPPTSFFQIKSQKYCLGKEPIIIASGTAIDAGAMGMPSGSIITQPPFPSLFSASIHGLVRSGTQWKCSKKEGE